MLAMWSRSASSARHPKTAQFSSRRSATTSKGDLNALDIDLQSPHRVRFCSVTVPSPDGIGQTLVPTEALMIMMKDQFANYVLQKMIDLANEQQVQVVTIGLTGYLCSFSITFQRTELINRIRPHVATLRCVTASHMQ